MASLEKLSAEQLAEVMAAAVGARARITVTIRHRSRWLTYRSRLLAAEGDSLWIAMPTRDGSPQPERYGPGEEIGVTFRVSNQRHVFGTMVLEGGSAADGGGKQVAALRVELPAELSRASRTESRVDMPARRVVRASLWLGGRDAMPEGPLPWAPVWSGRVLNLSAGGCCVRTDGEAGRYLDPGDVVGLRMLFVEDDEEVSLDAQLRHTEPDGRMVLLGFQFAELDGSERTARALAVIRAKADEYQAAWT